MSQVVDEPELAEQRQQPELAYQVTLTGDAAQLVKQLVNGAGVSPETLGRVISEALVVKKWFDDNVDEGKLYVLGAGGRMTEVRKTG